MTRALIEAERGEAARRRGSLWLWSAGAAAGFAVLELLLLRAGASSGPADSLRQVMRLGVLAQCLLVGIAAPALALAPVARERHRRTLDLLFLSRWRPAAVLAAKATLPLARVLALIVGSSLALWPLAWSLEDAGALRRLALTQLELCFVAAALVGLGLLCSTVVRSPSSAAAVAYLVVLAMMAGPLLIGPGIERLPGAGGVINASLVTSPVTALAAALEFDLMRTEAVYRLSPIGQRRFRYPSASTVLLFQAALAALAFGGSVWSFARQRRGYRH